MIAGLFFIALITILGMIARQVADSEGAKIMDALMGKSRPEPKAPARVVTISWQSAVRPLRTPLAAAA